MILFNSWKGRDGEKTRARIIEALRRQPGMDISQLTRAVGLSWSTTAYHLRLLRKKGIIQIESRSRRGLQCYLAGTPTAYRPWMATLRDESSVRVLRALERNRWLRMFEIRARVHLSERALRRKLRQLQEDHLVIKRGHFQPRFALSPELPEWIHEEQSG